MSEPETSDAKRTRPSFLERVGKWGEFVKFSHTVFALPFALASMAIAARETRGWPGWKLFGLILLALVTARTCAMAFNRIVDRDWDRFNPRTAKRHLVTGEIGLGEAWFLCIASGCAFIATAYFINPLCFYLSPLVLFFACFYSLTKRFTDFTHVFLGIALGLAPIGAWLAVEGSITLVPLRDSFLVPFTLGVSIVFWLIGFDIIYATQDYEFDRRHGLHSLVVRWGIETALNFARLSHLLMWAGLVVFGLLSGFGVAYFIGLIVILFSLLLEHWLAKRRPLKWVNMAFFRLNALISVVFLVVVLTEVIFPGIRTAQ